MRPVKLRKQIEAFMIKRVAYYNENIRNKINKFDSSNAKDIFFWPAMGNEKETVQDTYNPQWSSNTRFYEPGNGMDGSYERQISMWNHFVCTCGCPDLKESEYSTNGPGGGFTNVPKIVINENRLPVFSQMTNSEQSSPASSTSPSPTPILNIQ